MCIYIFFFNNILKKKIKKTSKEYSTEIYYDVNILLKYKKSNIFFLDCYKK